MLLSLTAHLQSPYLLPRGPTSCRFYHLFIEPEPGDQAFNKNTSHSDISIIVLVAFLVCRNDSAGKDTAKLGDQFTLWCERTNFLKKKKKVKFLPFCSFNKGANVFCTQLEATVYYSGESRMAGVCEAAGSMASVVRKQEADAATQFTFSLYSLVYPKP